MKQQVATTRAVPFYGWFALAGAMLAAFIDTGVFGYSYGVFLPSICNEFGWSRGTVSIGLSVGLLCFGLPSPLIGYLVSRFGPRSTIIFGNILGSIAIAGMFFIQEPWHIYVLYGIAGFGIGMGGYIPSMTTVNNWFIRKRSLATGIFIAATSASGFIFPPLVSVLISSIGWRMSWLVLAGVVLIGASLIAGVIIIRSKPEAMGQVPDGILPETEPESEDPAFPPEAAREPAAWSARQALKQPTTWFIGTFTAANLFAFHSMVGHQVAYVSDLGFSPVAAALSLSLLSGTGLVGSLGFGVLAMKIKMRNLAGISFIIRLVAMSLLLTTTNPVLVYTYATLMGISAGALLTAMPTMIGTYYGRAYYAQILGVIFTLQITAGALGPTVTGTIYDATGHYTPAFIALTAASVVGLFCAFLAKAPKSHSYPES